MEVPVGRKFYYSGDLDANSTKRRGRFSQVEAGENRFTTSRSTETRSNSGRGNSTRG